MTRAKTGYSNNRRLRLRSCRRKREPQWFAGATQSGVSAQDNLGGSELRREATGNTVGR